MLVPIGALLVRGGAFPVGGTDAVMLMTSVGEIRQVELADGSKVTLDTSTRIEVNIGRSHRSARLKYGRVRFQIVQANEPFVVETASTAISTREGVIDIEQGASEDQVRVLAGAADVRGSSQPQGSRVAIGAGQNATVRPTGAERTEVAMAAPDWTRGMLQFDGTPLAEAVTLSNRYSERRIILVGDLGALRVTGAFRAGDTSGLAKALAAAFHLSLQQAGDGSLILSRRPSSDLQNKKGG